MHRLLPSLAFTFLIINTEIHKIHSEIMNKTKSIPSEQIAAENMNNVRNFILLFSIQFFYLKLRTLKKHAFYLYNILYMMHHIYNLLRKNLRSSNKSSRL